MAISRTFWLWGGLAGAGVLYALARTDRGQQIAADVVGAVVSAAEKAKALIAGEEGLRLEVYQDTGGAWTIGYGHLVKPGDGIHPYGEARAISQERADQLFDEDLDEARDAVRRYVQVPINDNQRAALESFTFNVGVYAFRNSTLLRKLNIGDYSGAAAEFDRWVYDNGKRVSGLVDRRSREQEVFLA